MTKITKIAGLILFATALLTSQSYAEGTDSQIYRLQTELCLASPKDEAGAAGCYVDGYTSASMSIQLLTETLTEKFPDDFEPWMNSIKLSRAYRDNEEAVAMQVFAPGGNPQETVGGARSAYIIAMARLELLETYAAGFAK